MDIGYIGIVIIVILLSMTLHEVMHGFTAYLLGDTTAKEQGRLTLNPTKHIDPFMTLILPIMLALANAPIFGGAKPVPYNPLRVRYGDWGAALVALAGPLTNFIIAFIVFGIFTLSGVSSSSLVYLILVTAIYVNLGFFVFNMFPIPPLDGSRFVYAIAPEFVRRGMEKLERQGIILVFVLVLVASPLISIIMHACIAAILKFFAIVFGSGVV